MPSSGPLGVGLRTILIVDDDPATRSLLRLIFETAGHVVVEAPNGRAALESISRYQLPDVVVTDLMMPVLDGAELIEHLHSEPETASILIVVVSGSPEARNLKALGVVQAVIRKPFDAHDLLDCVERLPPVTPYNRVSNQ